MFKKAFFIFAILFFSSCASDAIDTIEQIADLIDDPDRKEIDVSMMGVNAFVNDQRFGSISGQFIEVRDTLGINYVRVLFAWNDQVQPTPEAEPDFSFYDNIVASLPARVEAVAVLTGVPSWMYDPANFANGNPRAFFAEQWVRKVVTRYAGKNKINAFQIWNEPNMEVNSDNIVMDFIGNPVNYVEMLGMSYSVIKDVAPQKLVVTSATTAINQNWKDSLNYNKNMRDSGAESFCDIWAIHYYGKQYERVVTDNGIEEFIEEVSRPIWITEIGEQGFDKQLEYIERTWPYLQEKMPNIQRFYYYQFTEDTSAETTYGLRNLTEGQMYSDLYIWLRDR